MNKLKNKNKSISKIDDNNDEQKKISEKSLKQIKSIKGYDCIGPCYPANTVFYNPLTLIGIKSKLPSCPIKKREINFDNNKKKIIYADICNPNDVNNEYLTFDIFIDSIKLASNDDIFLNQIYDIKNISDVVYFLSNSIDTFPIYSQRRILNAIFNIYYKYVEFPKKLFSTKLLFILENIYKINNLNDKNMISIIDLIDNNSLNLYKYFLEQNKKILV